LKDHPNLQFIQGDVLNFEDLKQAAQGTHYIVHLAAIAGVDSVRTMPVKTMKIALLGTYHALEAAAAEPDMLRFIDFSTSEVFGQYAYRVQEGEATNLGAVGEARWTYAVSKLASEHLAHNYHKEFGLPTVSVRPFNIYGPGQLAEGAVLKFVLRAIQGEPLIVFNDGSQIRAWCYIDDIVDAILLCLTEDGAKGQVFNIGNPRSVLTIYDLARRVIQLSGSPSQIQFVENSNPDVELRIPNIDKARQLLGFEPKVDLDEGLLRTIEWYRQHR